MISIREATPADIPELALVHVSADWQTHAPLFGTEAYALDVVACEQRWRKALQDGDTLLIAGDEGAMVGVGHAHGDRITALYLLPGHHRKGIGKAILGRLLQTLHERGVAEARFDVVAVNAPAIAFYTAQGARPVGRCINRDARGDTEDLIFAIPTAGAAR